MPTIFSPQPGGFASSRSDGFTLIEIVVVMVLMSIITAVVLGRSITTTDIDVAGQTDKIRNQLRYAQSVAMKRSDDVWGIRFDVGNGRYWYFKGTDPSASQILLPGGEYSGGDQFIKLSDLGISLTIVNIPGGTVYFDRIGKPYTAYTDETTNTPLGSTALVRVSAAGSSRDILITPETGFIR